MKPFFVYMTYVNKKDKYIIRLQYIFRFQKDRLNKDAFFFQNYN